MRESRDAAAEKRWGAVVLTVAALAVVGSAAWRANVLWFVHPPSDRPRVVDVSWHQGDIDWRRVARDGVRGAWIKATEGGDFVDPRFGDNRAGARAAGLAVGAYHFFTFCRPPEDQAENFLKTVGGDWGTLPPAVDVERGGNCAKVPSPGELAASLAAFLAPVEAAAGRPALLYVIADQLDGLLGGALPDRELWVRSLFAEPSLPGRTVAVWQFHSRGWIDGVTGAVDLNVVDPTTFAGWTAPAAN